MNIVDSCPDYITEFVNLNTKNLIEIYNTESPKLSKPLLCLNFCKSKNKIDVYCWEMNNIISGEQIKDLESLYKGNKFIFIKDIELESSFTLPISTI